MLDILVVDDEAAVRISIGKALAEAGHQVTEAEDGPKALSLILSRVFDVVVFDIRLPGVDGLTLFRRLHMESPGTAVVLMTAHARVRDAVEALRGGALDYVVKPFDPGEFAAKVIGPIAERHALRDQFEQARAQLTARDVGTELVGCSPFAARIRAEIDSAAQSHAPLLIRGERGTGKRLVARLVHDRGARRSRPYVAVSCASLPPDTMEGDLFGYAPGGFAGAPGAEQGYFKAAQGGTLVLADIGAMPTTCQARVATALRDEAVVPLGMYSPVPIDVRVIATSHENLEARVADGDFREDLLCKLNVLDVYLVPLRERPADLLLLFEYFSRRITRSIPPKIAPRAWDALCAYRFPGNVDEMQDAIKHALARARGSIIDIEHLPAAVVSSSLRPVVEAPRRSSGTRPKAVSLRPTSGEQVRTSPGQADPPSRRRSH
jgi:DNA-binding NtrC family response regulator